MFKTVPTFVDFQDHTNEKGELKVLDIPFEVRRMYTISSVPLGQTRGHHAHKRLQQIMIAISGAFSIRLFDGRVNSEFSLNSHSPALYIPPGHWRELGDFTHNAKCLVLASEMYDPLDYIHSMDEFIDWIER